MSIYKNLVFNFVYKLFLLRKVSIYKPVGLKLVNEVLYLKKGKKSKQFF